MADNGDERLRRTSSQLSTASIKSNKAKNIRNRPRKSLSNTSATISTNIDPSLTSFPSLSPETTPETKRRSGQVEQIPQPNRTVSQKAKHRKATLAGLTNASPSLNGQALFDESPRSSSDVPGALHLATDEHIERLIARSGAVKLIRQFAQDLAQRDAELSALRRRADERERELKRILREAGIPTIDIEQRLRSVDTSPDVSDNDHAKSADRRNKGVKKVTSSIDSLMHDAMHDDVGVTSGNHVDGLSQRVQQINGDVDSRSPRIGFETSRKRTVSIKSWQDYIWGSNTTSRGASGTSSIASDDQEDADATARPRNLSGAGRRKGLENLFSPSSQPQASSYFIGGAKKPSRKPSVAENMGSQAKKTSRTISTWTKLFAGNPQAGKDISEQNTVRGRTGSGQHGGADSSRAASLASTKDGAGLSRVTSGQGPRSSQSTISGGVTKANAQTVRRAGQSSSVLASSPDASRSDANLGPVEMDAILPMDSKPPTMRHTYSNYDAKGLLTDRFGFIYDQRQRKRQREAAMAVKESKRKSFVESLNSFRTDSDVEAERDSLRPIKSKGAISPMERPSSPTSVDDVSEPIRGSRWQDYLRIATRPTELLSHTPSTGPLVSLTIADAAMSPVQSPPLPKSPTPGSPALGSRTRGSSLSIDTKRGTVPSVSVNPEPSTSDATANMREFSANSGPSTAPPISSSLQQLQQEPVKMLLDQLIDLHDSLQAEKTVKWNEFLRKVRAERGAAAVAASTGPDNKKLNMPEASLVDGEMVGVSNLGHKGKLGRAKWKEFKTLVLGGIPVAHRSKIWSECTGASALRVPGYYEDLVAASSLDSFDPEVTSQIQADIYRTLTDNVFFRLGPGVSKLREVLLAYAKRNPGVGYCQGMNLITGSLLLIMPTAEDAFWILVAMVENILPSNYYDHGLVGSRADQVVLREYVSEVLPKLGAHLDELGVELEALTFQWFLSVFTDCLSAEALYRVWDVVLCLNSTSSAGLGATTANSTTSRSKTEPPTPASSTATVSNSTTNLVAAGTGPAETDSVNTGTGTGSTFLFQLALALLKLNESALLACDGPAAVYSYINHEMTNHAISIDGLIQASEGLRATITKEDVLVRRKKAVEETTGLRSGTGASES